MIQSHRKEWMGNRTDRTDNPLKIHSGTGQDNSLQRPSSWSRRRTSHARRRACRDGTAALWGNRSARLTDMGPCTTWKPPRRWRRRRTIRWACPFRVCCRGCTRSRPRPSRTRHSPQTGKAWSMSTQPRPRLCRSRSCPGRCRT